MNANFSKLKRHKYQMSDFIKLALKERDLMRAYKARPAYQQNDYLGWINTAKRQATKEKRLRQMLDELGSGGVYMNMKHPASKK